jgi:hypothetical protein
MPFEERDGREWLLSRSPQRATAMGRLRSISSLNANGSDGWIVDLRSFVRQRKGCAESRSCGKTIRCFSGNIRSLSGNGTSMPTSTIPSSRRSRGRPRSTSAEQQPDRQSAPCVLNGVSLNRRVRRSVSSAPEARLGSASRAVPGHRSRPI